MIITNKTGSNAKPIPANLPPLGLNSISTINKKKTKKKKGKNQCDPAAHPHF